MTEFRFQVGRRYLVKWLPSDGITEVLVLEVSPQGRVKVRDLLDGRVLWWDGSRLDEVLVLEELPGGETPSSSDMYRRIVRE